MVAIFTGLGTGFERGSGSLLGSSGLLGSSSLGRGGEQLFFNAATGNLMISQRDEYLVGRGLDAAVARTYNSLGDLSDDNGDNWRQGYDRRIVNLTGTLNSTGSTVQRVSGDGSVITYSWDAAKAAYIATDGAGSYDKLTSSGGVWTWTDGDSQVRETYASYGGYWRLSSQSDVDGNSVTFTYTADKLTQVTTADGSTLTYSWSGNNLMSVTASAQTVADDDSNFAYRIFDAAFDRIPEPTAIANYLAALKNGVSRSAIAQLVYSSAEYTARGVQAMSNTEFAAFLFQSVLRRTGSSGEIAYWSDTISNGMSRSEVLLFFAESAEHKSYIANIPGRSFYGTVSSVRTRYSYDGLGRLSSVSVDLSPDDNSVADGNAYVTTYTYDGSSKRVASIAQSDGSLIALSYDGSGRVIKMVETASSGVMRTTDLIYGDGYTAINDPLGGLTRLDYDANGRLINIQHVENRTPFPNGSSATGWGIDYDQFGTAGAVYAGSSQGRNYVAANVNATGANQNFSIGTDAENWMAVTANEVLHVEIGIETSGTVDAATLSLHYLDAAGNYLSSEHIGTLLGTISFNTKIYGAVRVPAGAAKVRFEVYARASGAGAGTLKLIDPVLGSPRPLGSFSYNGNGDLTGVTDPLGNVTSFSNFDANGNAQTVTDRLGNITTRTFGSKNELLTETTTSSDTASAAAAHTIRYVYDAENHLSYVISAEGAVTKFVYTAQGQQASAIKYSIATYDVSGLSSSQAPSLAAMDSWASSLGWTQDIQQTDYSYDARGGLISQTEYSDLYVNRLDNTQFYGTGGWTIGWDGNGIVANGSPYAGEWGGKRYLKAQINASANNQTTSLATAYESSFDVTAGERIAVSAGAEAQGSVGILSLYVHFFDANGAYLTGAWVSSLNGNQPFNTQMAGFADVPANATRARFELYATSVGTGAGSFALIDPMVSQATIGQTSVPISPVGNHGMTGAHNKGGNYGSLTRSTFVYDQSGRLRSSRVNNRNTETYVYDGLDRLVAAVDVNGATTSYVFDDANTKTTVSLANGLTQVSTYNKMGELISYAEAGPSAVTGTANYGYDKAGQLRWQVDATGRKSYFVYDQLGRKVADVGGDGSVVESRFDANGRKVATVIHGVYLSAAQLAALDDANAVINLATFFPAPHYEDIFQWTVYDREGRVAQQIDGDGSTTTFVYDQSGRLVSSTSYYNKIGSASTSAFRTAAPTAVVLPTSDARDRVVRNFYDKDGWLVGTLDGEGYLTKNVYDKAGQKIQDKRYANPTSGNRASDSFNTLVSSIAVDPSKDRDTFFSYDGQGHLRFVVDSLGYVAQTDYDAAGQPTVVTQYAIAIASTNDFTYDNVKALVASGNLPASAGTRASYTVYDSAGRAAYVIDPEGAVTANSFNAVGQVVKTVRFANARATTSLPTLATMDSWKTASAWPSADRTTRYFYDGSGALRYTVDGEGFVAQIDYDAEGREVHTVRWSNAFSIGDSTTIADLTSLLNASGSDKAESWTSYDAQGRVEYQTNAAGITTRWLHNANGTMGIRWDAWGVPGQQTLTGYTYFYDGGSKVKVERQAWLSANETATEYAYDGFGEVIAVTDPNGKVTTNAYDRRGQLVTQTDAIGGVTNFQYDAFGSAVKVIDPRGNASYNYYDRRGLRIATRDAEDYITETSYTAFGQVDTVIRRYNKATNTASVGSFPTVAPHAQDASTHMDYDRLGRVIKLTDAEGNYEQYGLNAFGDRTSVRNKIGGTTTNVYDRRGLLISETLPMAVHWADGSVQAWSVTNKFEYDARGNRTRMIEGFGLAEQRTTNYQYDRLNRLINKNYAVGTTLQLGWISNSATLSENFVNNATANEWYSYDALGRLKSTANPLGGRTVYFYDFLGRKTAEVSPVGTLSTWTYDANGNMLSARVYGDAVSVPSDTDPQPSPVNAGNYRETTYSYDNINRLKTTSIGNVFAGSWNGSTGVTPATQTVTSTLDYDAAGNVIKATDPSGNAVYAYFDRLGRKVAQVDAENYITTWTYDAEGNVKTEARYATRYTGTPVAGGAVPSVSADATNDRVTDFTYDRNGRRLTEARAGVKIASVNATSGAITESIATSSIAYTYNGLGQVLSKAEATGDTVTYSYDQTGRLTKESRASYTDETGNGVTPTVDYLYNGLNDLIRTRQGGISAEAGDRVTTYVYGTNGRLYSVTDPAGGTHTYLHDAAGNVTRDSYVRTKSDGSTVNEAVVYVYDAIGRVISQSLAAYGTAWVHGDVSETMYNAFGEISRRGINGGWQEGFAYNNRGLVEKSNSGDGVWRFYVYDKNGNRTATIEDENYSAQDLSAKTILDVLGYVGGTFGQHFIDGLTVSIAAYDKRGQAIFTIATHRELKAGDPRVNITSSSEINAFGEVTRQTDALNNITDFTYNTMGRLIKKELPAVNWTSASGVVSQARPTELYWYDRSGRMVAYADPNRTQTGGGATSWSRTLLAGSGYGDSEALVTAEFHPDGGVARTFYSKFGDARILRNELGFDEWRDYDGMGRLTYQSHRSGLIDYYTYDLLGQRTRHWNSFYGSGVYEATDYELQGRVTTSKNFAGDVVTTGYAWDATIATALGTTGGIVQSEYHAGLGTKVTKTDIYGNDVFKYDVGNHATYYTYDKAGRLTQVSGSNSSYTTTLTHSYLNTGLVAQTVDSAGAGLNAITGTFAYDLAGNRIAEKYAGTVYKSISDASWNSYVSSTQTLQDATVTYDALGRMVSLTNKDAAGAVIATLSQQYDLSSNIRRTQATYPNLVAGGTKSSDKWFTYDAMNRMVVADGGFSGAAIVYKDVTGASSLSYDLAGNRKTKQVKYRDYDPDSGLSYNVTLTETYTYDANNQLTNISTPNDGGTTYTTTITRDGMGRVTRYTEANPSFVLQDRYNIVYNARGQVTSEWSSQRKGTDTFLNKVTNTYNSTTGMQTSSVSDNYKNGVDSGALDTSMTNGYVWYDEGKQLSTSYDRDTDSSSNSIYTTNYVYDGLGRLQRALINDGINRTVHFAVTADEQILLRDVNNSGANDPEDHHIFINGRQVGEWTSDDGKNIDNLDYETAITNNTLTSTGGTKFYRGGSAVAGGEFGTSTFTPFNPLTVGSGQNASTYTVKGGDTLQGIAASLWGDASLWYKLGEANGLSAGAALVAGQTLSVPVGVVKNSNNASTFNPYDPARATGDLSPTTNKPPKKNKCGMFGQILVAIVSVAVTIIAAPLGPLAPVVGNLAGQVFGMATGIQHGFNWKSLALTAISAGVAPPGTGGIVTDAINGAIANATVQGIAVATGLQKKFDWVGVAAAGVSAGAGTAAGGIKGFNKLGIGVQQALGGTARAIANAATRSALSGSSFGDNLLAGLPDVLAQTVVGFAQDGINAYKASRARSDALARSQEKLNAFQESPTAQKLAGLGVTFEASENGIRATLPGDFDERLKADNTIHSGSDIGFQKAIDADTWAFDTVAGDWQKGVQSGRLYFQFDGLGGANFNSQWISFGDKGAVRLISRGDSGTYLALSGNERVEALGLTLSFGSAPAAISRGDPYAFDLPNFSKSFAPTPIGLSWQDRYGVSDRTYVRAYTHQDSMRDRERARWQAFTSGDTAGLAATLAWANDADPNTIIAAHNADAIFEGLAGATFVKSPQGRAPVFTTGRYAPNPYGKMGGPAHQAIVAEIVADIRYRGLTPKQEFRILTPDGPKNARYVDVVAIDPISKLPVEFYQVGKQTKAGHPISREAQAIRDIQRVTNQPVTFKPYNSLGN